MASFDGPLTRPRGFCFFPAIVKFSSGGRHTLFSVRVVDSAQRSRLASQAQRGESPLQKLSSPPLATAGQPRRTSSSYLGAPPISWGPLQVAPAAVFLPIVASSEGSSFFFPSIPTVHTPGSDDEQWQSSSDRSSRCKCLFFISTLLISQCVWFSSFPSIRIIFPLELSYQISKGKFY